VTSEVAGELWRPGEELTLDDDDGRYRSEENGDATQELPHGFHLPPRLN
jgi:hypothetical protein